MATHSSTLAWRIPWMEEPGRLGSMGSRRVWHDWATSLSFSLSPIGEGNGNPLQCSCLENPRDSGAWWAAGYGVAQSRTRLKRLSSSRSRSIVSFKICVSLLIFCLFDLSIGVSGVLKSPTIIVLLLISPFILLNISSRMEVLLCWMHIYYDCYMFFLDWSFDHYVAAIFVSCHALYFKVYFTWYECCYS